MNTLLFDFAYERSTDGWLAINDVVMGGVSSGKLEATGFATAVFSGCVSLENNGGFASARSRLATCDLRGCSGLELHVSGDDRRYKINVKTATDPDGILYAAAFEARGQDWQIIRIPFSQFLPTQRGRIVYDAPPLDLAAVSSVGLMVSDRQTGPFRLEIARIEAY